MNWFTGTTVFLVIWWLVVFIVLPWGNRPIDGADISRGHASSAPKKPRLVIKMIVTTAIASVLWVIFYALVGTGWITFRSG